MSYFGMHNHTDYSNTLVIDSTNKVERLLSKAQELGLTGLAITDHGNISAHVKAARFVKEQNWDNFKLALGEEFYLCPNGRNKETAERGQKYPHCILIAKDAIGHRQLRQLSSRAWSRSFVMFLTRIPLWYSDIEEIIGADPGHIIATTACIGGVLYEQDTNKAIEIIDWFKKYFKDDFYLEMAPAGYEEQVAYNKWLLDLSNMTHTPFTIATDAHYLRPEDREVHTAFLKSKEEERETAEFYQYTYLMTDEEIFELMGYFDRGIVAKGLDNTNEALSKIETYDLAEAQHIPHLTDDRVNDTEWERNLSNTRVRAKFEYINNFINSQYEDDRYFIYLGLLKLKELRLPKEKLEQYLERLEQEMAECWLVSERLGQPISSYMLMVRNIIQIMWNEANSIVGVARGSAGVMLINYLIGVTQMNPLEQGVYLPEWRFLHRDKVEIPDIDVDSEGVRKQIIIQKMKEAASRDGGDALNICTFGTEGTRSAILTAARGLGIDIDTAQYLSGMIPQERGFLWPLSDCVYGNAEKDRRPIKSLINEFNNYPGLLDTALGIEGLVCRLGIHACGMIVTNEPTYIRNASMKAPNGLEVTQYDLGDSEYLGGLKMDCLSVEGMDKIHACLDLLLEDGLIEWQGSLKATYDKYLHPDVLERDNQTMWKKIWDNEIIDIFQMDSSVGKQILATAKPSNIPELSAANSLMRLMPEPGQKTPAEEFIEYKENPKLLKEHIYALKATDVEKDILYNFMKQYGGVLDSQESAMLAVMIPEFTGYDVPHANKIRKIIAKKKMKEISSAREEYFSVGLEKGVSEDILRYIWDVQIKKQLGYSFSLPHTVAYSLIALQEMNLASKFPSVYWTTACMTVNSGGLDDEETDTKGTNYGKLSSAIGRVQAAGVKVELPDINKAKFGFSPDAENNGIIFGLKGISEINDEFARLIVSNRPYNNLQEFLDKCQPHTKQMINLLKAGCFDNFGVREELMHEYLKLIVPQKSRITLQNMAMLINYKLIPNVHMKYARLFNFNRYIKQYETPDGYKLDGKSLEYFTGNFEDDIIINKNGLNFLSKAEWDKIYKKQMEGIKDYLKDNEQILIDKIHNAEIQEIWNKYCQGNLSSWEMDTLGYYYSGHELANVNSEPFEITKITDLPYEPEVIRYYERNGQQIPMFKISTIMGTVLDRTSYKHTVSLLTPEGVISLKCVNEQFAKYNKTISDTSGEVKKILEQSWFKKGTKLIVNGWKNGDQFMVRGRANEKIYPLYRIVEIDDLGCIKTTRYRADEV